MSGGVFLKRGDDLIEMVEQPYDLEDHLQELIERHPNLLAGDQVNPDAPRRWLMLTREAKLASEEGGADRWSVDHLLLDQDAIPTLVEVKRSSNTEIRRAVVGQMLDYAANAVTYWNLDVLRDRYEEAVKAQGREPEVEIGDLLSDEDADYDGFWERAKANLRAGRIRLVIVADKIPTELERVVEFLNEQMSPADVLAVEIRQYVGGDEQVLAPRVRGQTAEARQKKSPGGPRASRQWDEQSFLAETGRQAGQVEAGVVRAVLDYWAREAFPLRWGTGAIEATVGLSVDVAGSSYRLFFLQADSGKMAINFVGIASKPPFDQDSKRLELLRRFNDIPGVALSESAVTGAPRIPLATFAPPDALAKLLEVIEWFRLEAASTNP